MSPQTFGQLPVPRLSVNSLISHTATTAGPLRLVPRLQPLGVEESVEVGGPRDRHEDDVLGSAETRPRAIVAVHGGCGGRAALGKMILNSSRQLATCRSAATAAVDGYKRSGARFRTP